ncbi:hypothetical protein AAVH_28558, partial [Aphelenchoides avenae]
AALLEPRLSAALPRKGPAMLKTNEVRKCGKYSSRADLAMKKNERDSKKNQRDPKKNQRDSKKNQRDSKKNQRDSKKNKRDSKKNKRDLKPSEAAPAAAEKPKAAPKDADLQKSSKFATMAWRDPIPLQQYQVEQRTSDDPQRYRHYDKNNSVHTAKPVVDKWEPHGGRSTAAASPGHSPSTSAASSRYSPSTAAAYPGHSPSTSSASSRYSRSTTSMNATRARSSSLLRYQGSRDDDRGTHRSLHQDAGGKKEYYF